MSNVLHLSFVLLPSQCFQHQVLRLQPECASLSGGKAKVQWSLKLPVTVQCHEINQILPLTRKSERYQTDMLSYHLFSSRTRRWM